MSSKQMKIVGLLAALTVFGAVFATAASIGTVTTDNLAAGDAGVAACDTDGVAVSWTVSYDAATADYQVDTVTVDGIAEACADEVISVTLTGPGTSDAPVSEQSQTVAGTSEALDFSADDVPAEAVTAAHVVVNNTASTSD